MGGVLISEAPEHGEGRSAREGDPADGRPTTVRWRIMTLVAVVNMLPSLGRISLGVTAKSLQEEFQFSTMTMGWVLSAFWLSYGLFQLPGGWAGDRYGPRRVLTLAILWYSLFMATMATIPTIPANRCFGLAWSFAAVQFLIGAGEAFTAPNSAKIVGSWMNKKKLGFGISFTTLGIGAGGCVTPIFIVWTMQRWGWRTSFLSCGLIGVLVAVVWGWYVTNGPEEHRGVNTAELARIRAGKMTSNKSAASLSGRTPWRRMFSSGSVWALLVSYACRAYPMYFFNTWFFIYLVKVRGLTVVRGGIMSATPFLAVLLLSPVGGWFSDFASNRPGLFRSACLDWLSHRE
jgi:MFS transporter, ACS family, glucarate transporter